MARNRDARSKIIELLAEGASVSFACKKIGLSRPTFYRWRDSNIEFREQVEAALELGRLQFVDLAKHSLLQLVKDKHFGAIKFVLQHNDKQYAPRYPMDPLSPKERAEYEKASREMVATLISDEPLSDAKADKLVEHLVTFGIINDPYKDKRKEDEDS